MTLNCLAFSRLHGVGERETSNFFDLRESYDHKGIMTWNLFYLNVLVYNLYNFYVVIALRTELNFELIYRENH